MFLLSIIFDWKSSLWILRRGNHFKGNKNILLIIQVSLFHKKTCHCTVFYCETKHEGYIAMLLDPFVNKMVLLNLYSILCELFTIKDAWKVQKLIQIGNRMRKIILEICFVLSSSHLFFSVSQQSTADDQFKPFNEPGGCSPSLSNLKRDLDPNTGGTESRSWPALL